MIESKTNLDRLAIFFGSAVSFIGVLGLLGWVTGVRELASIRAAYLPMSPDASMAFMLFGLIVFFNVRPQYSRGSKVFISIIIATVSIYGLLKFAEYFLNVDLTFENILFPTTEKIGAFIVKRMSPITGSLFFLSGIALQLEMFFGTHQKMSNVIGSIGVVTLATGFVAAVGYLFGTPLLYGGNVIPMSAPTAVGFLLLGCGLVAISGRQSIFVRPFVGSLANARLLRALLPLIVSAIFIQGFLDDTLTRVFNINEALITALLSLIFAALTAGIVVQLSRIIFRRADEAEAERRQADEALRRSEEKFRAIFENNSSAIAIIEQDTTLSMVNDAYCQMSGLTKEEVVGMSWTQQIPPEDLGRLKEYNRRRLINPDDAPDKYEFNFYRKDGEIRHALMSVAMIPSSQKIVTSFTDITERKRAEETIKMNEVRLESILKISQHKTESTQELLDFALSEAITLTGSKIGYVYFYDDKKQEFTLNTWSKDVMKECNIAEQQTLYKLETTGIWGEAVRQKKPIVVNDFLAANPLKKGYPEGHSPLLKFLTIPVISEDRIVAVVGVANKEIDYTDADVQQLTLMMDSVWQISERKRAEGEIRKLSRAVDQSPASIVITDVKGAIEYVNPKFIQITGYSLEEVIGENSRILKSGEKPAEEYKQLWDTIISGYEWRGEFHNKKKNGELYWESAIISPIKNEQGVVTHFLAVKEDITQRRQAEVERENLINELKEALADVKTLSGLIPICSSCKKIRDDKGYWNILEGFLMEHSDAKFTHGLCPDCMAKLYPKFMNTKPPEQG